MTSEQMDELMTVAVNMQRDSEKAGDRPTAMFAYAVQVAVLELRKVRTDCTTLAAENAGLKAALNKIAFTYPLSPQIHEMTTVETPSTDAFLAEVRAQGVDMFAASLGSPYVERGEECYQDGYTHAIERIKCHKAPEFAAQLRKGVQS